MYRKNTASQFVCFQMLLTATGAVATGLSPAVRRCIDGTFAAGGGTVTEDSAGFYKYAMAQADTNGNDISLMFSAATAMPVCVNIVTTAADPTDAVAFGLSRIDGTITSRMATYTQPTGFLAATFPTGTVANTTNITAGTITTTTNLTTNNDKTGYALTSGERNSVADAMLDRDMSTGADSGSTTVRTVRQALRFLRNKFAIVAGTMTVYKEDDTTASWTSAITTTAGNPVSSSDPAG